MHIFWNAINLQLSKTAIEICCCYKAQLNSIARNDNYKCFVCSIRQKLNIQVKLNQDRILDMFWI